MNASRLLLLLAILGASTAYAVERPTDRPYVEGVVVDEQGDPVAGVEYWTTGYRLGKNGDKGHVIYTGIVRVNKTDESGRFLSVYGGAGREEQAIDVAFRSERFAPAWLINANREKGPYTVTLERGVKLTGLVVSEDRPSDEKVRHPGKLDLTLAVFKSESGGGVVEIPIETNYDGWFEVRLPTEYWTCEYRLRFAGNETELRFEKDTPLPKLRVKVQTEIEQVDSIADL